MPRYVLRPVDPRDPRPSITDTAVALRAIDLYLEEIKAWVTGRGATPNEAAIRVEVAQALKLGGTDGFRCAQVLALDYNWPADEKLAALMKTLGVALHDALRTVSGEWVARTGIRFPGKIGDTVEFIAADGQPQVGVLTDLLSTRATGYVKIGVGAGETEDVLVPAETVTGNVTQSLYTTIRPVLGARYEDAPALAAAYEAAEAERRRHLIPETEQEREVREMLSDAACHVSISDGPPDGPWVA